MPMHGGRWTWAFQGDRIIVIWKQRGLLRLRLSDYWVFVSDTQFSPSETPATLTEHGQEREEPQTAVRFLWTPFEI